MGQPVAYWDQTSVWARGGPVPSLQALGHRVPCLARHAGSAGWTSPSGCPPAGDRRSHHKPPVAAHSHTPLRPGQGDARFTRSVSPPAAGWRSPDTHAFLQAEGGRRLPILAESGQAVTETAPRPCGPETGVSAQGGASSGPHPATSSMTAAGQSDPVSTAESCVVRGEPTEA